MDKVYLYPRKADNSVDINAFPTLIDRADLPAGSELVNKIHSGSGDELVTHEAYAAPPLRRYL